MTMPRRQTMQWPLPQQEMQQNPFQQEIQQLKQKLFQTETKLKDSDDKIYQMKQDKELLRKVIESQHGFYDEYIDLLESYKDTQINFAQLLYGMSTIQGIRPSNEDSEVCTQFAYNNKKYLLIAVFDGHGGDEASKYCKKFLIETLCLNQNFQKHKYKQALVEVFNQLDKEFCKENDKAGCTATLILITEDQMWSANLGDSRQIVKYANRVYETLDHKPGLPIEKQRVVDHGSFVMEQFGISRVAGALAVSRSIGDKSFKEFGVISTPDVQKLCTNFKWLMAACDGIYDVFDTNEIVHIVQHCLGTLYTGQDQKIKNYCEAALLYLAGENQKGDEVMKKFYQIDENLLVNCDQVDATQNVCSRISTLLTRMAFVAGSEDNVSVIIVVNNDSNEIEPSTSMSIPTSYGEQQITEELKNCKLKIDQQQKSLEFEEQKFQLLKNSIPQRMFYLSLADQKMLIEANELLTVNSINQAQNLLIQIPIQKDQIPLFQQRLSQFMTAKHQNVVNIIDHFSIMLEKQLRYITVIEIGETFIPLKKLLQLIGNQKKFLKCNTIDLLFDLSAGLAYLQQKAIVHGNIKPQNLYFSAGEDPFMFLGVPRVQSFVDDYTDQQANGHFSFATDIYSLGCVFYVMLTGKEISTRQGQLQFNELWLDRRYQLQNQAALLEIISLVNAMMDPEPADRPQPMVLFEKLTKHTSELKKQTKSFKNAISKIQEQQLK
uniref:Protein phosphatase 2C n=1 Tax=Trepomonas sp. PC1 TaxID=1076344 RepID=A0A146KK32_9EUKA|eukprot:JAP95609.1 Protein phosphatase 2C [Trepomonas sp. PC1]